jgi:hypothetical protein
MTILHDPATRDAIRVRIRMLPAGARPRWGKMSVDQMLWHCNQVLRTSLGEIRVVPRRPPLPVSVLKFVLFHMPWPHGAPTAPEYQADTPHDFEAERRESLELIDRFAARELDHGEWGRAVFGRISGWEWSRLQARHLDHHLRQFGV